MQALGLVWGEVDKNAPDFQERAIEIDGPRHPGARLTQRVWQQHMERGGFVVGRDIPSRALSSVLRNLAVYEPIEQGRDFRVRIAGTAFYRRFGQDVTGACLSELFDATGHARARAALMQVVAQDRQRSAAVAYAQGSRTPMCFEMLLLPVSAPDLLSRWVLVGLFFQDWAR